MAVYKFKECMQEYTSILDSFLSEFTSNVDLTSPANAASLANRSSSPVFANWWSHHLAPKHIDTSEKKATLELAFKSKLDEVIRVESTGFDTASNRVALLLDGALWCRGVGSLDPLAHLGLIEDLLESQTLTTAELLFTQILNTRIDLFIKASDTQRARLLFFRMCNNLLRRLSKTTNTFFSGQISMKISYICPVDERSAVNPGGRFNKENITLVNDPPPVVREEGEEEPAKGESVYEQLWSLQNFFADPLALKTPAVLDAFHRSADSTLTQFERIGLGEKEAVAAIISSNGVGVGAAAEPSVFPKYLTGGRLLELQLKDAVFRREVALQLLIFLAHLLNPLGNVEVMREIMSNTPQVNHMTPITATTNSSSTSATTASGSGSSSTSASLSSTSATATVNQQLAQTSLSGAFLPVASLPPLRTLFLRTLKLYKLIPPFAYQFAESFLTLLSREQKFWIGWKEAKCPPIERSKLSKKDLLQPIDVEQVAKELREKRQTSAGVSIDATKSDDASRKRKAGAMMGGGPFAGGGGGFRPKPKMMFDMMESSASLKVNSRWLMGTENLAKVWDPSLDSNSSQEEFLKSEDRLFMPNLQQWIQTLWDEEEEWQQVLEKKKAKAEDKKARLAKAKEEKASQEGVKKEEGDVEMSNADGGMEEGDGEGEYEDEDEDDGSIRLQDMLKSDSRKQWQFLRLCLLTPFVECSWLRSSGDADDDTPLPLISGIDLFVRSEGSLIKLVDSWLVERKKGQLTAQQENDNPPVEDSEEKIKADETNASSTVTDAPSSAGIPPTDAAASPIDTSTSTGTDPISSPTPDASPLPSDSPVPAVSPTDSMMSDAAPSSAASSPVESVITDAANEDEPPTKRIKVDHTNTAQEESTETNQPTDGEVAAAPADSPTPSMTDQ